MKTSNILLFIGGAVVGAAGMYFGMRKYFEDNMEAEIADVQDYYERKLSDMEAKNALVSVEVASDDAKPEVKITRAKVDAEVEPDYDEIIHKLNYNQFSTKTSDDEDYVVKDDPRIISFDEYGNGSYDAIECIWFCEDEVLMNSITEEVIDDPDNEVGLRNMELFGSSDGGDDDDLYIRNERLGCEYHVCLEVSTSYANSTFAGSEDDE